MPLYLELMKECLCYRTGQDMTHAGAFQRIDLNVMGGPL